MNIRNHSPLPGVRITLLILALLFILVACAEKKEQASQYICPMHPTYVSDKPGTCPICGMDLVQAKESPQKPHLHEKEKGLPEKKEVSTSKKVLFYRNPMDPSVTSPVPAKDEMGMDYIPVYSGDDAPSGEKGVQGMATVVIDEKGIHLAGIQSVKAVRKKLEGDIRAVGIVKADESNIRHVHTKISGWIEKLFVNTTGQVVQTGQTLLSIYSPELLASQEEYLRAKEYAARFADSSIPEVRKGGEDLLRAARKRLELFDVPKSLIEQIEKTGKTERTVTLLAPASGFVFVKQVYEGQQIEPGMELFTITDLSTVWIEADFYEYESQFVRIGQKGIISLAYDPKKRITGQVSYIYPYLDPQSRTLRARFEFPNPDLFLKPQMYVNVLMKIAIPDSVVIPDSAIMNTGLRQIVFVGKGEDRFEPREIRVGYRSSGMAQIISGVKEGESVVVRANFLLDSESRLRAAIMKSATRAADDDRGNP
ncbi:MAG: efflux RND transporter periplasmic adaptor subunit [Thermodesulfobacteriota bacterium]